VHKTDNTYLTEHVHHQLAKRQRYLYGHTSDLVCKIKRKVYRQFEALGLQKAFEESANWTLLSCLCYDSSLHISAFMSRLRKGDTSESSKYFHRKSISRNTVHPQSYNHKIFKILKSCKKHLLD